MEKDADIFVETLSILLNLSVQKSSQGLSSLERAIFVV